MRYLQFLLLLPLVWSCEKKEVPPQERENTVTTMSVQPSEVPVSFEYIATSESSRQVNIRARVDGFLNKRVYTEGTMVEENQILFEMDKKPFIAKVDAAEAALERRVAAMKTAKLNMDRAIPLEKLNALSEKDMDDAIGAYESTAASVEEAKANLLTAQLNLSYCTIRSPLYGVSSDALQKDGSYINAENSLLTNVSQLDPIWINFSLSENQLQKYRNETSSGLLIPPKNDEYEIEIFLVDGSTFPYKGKITFLEPYYNSNTGTFLIRSSVENPKGVLRPNQYVHVRVSGAIRPNGILVPQRAVHQSSKGHYVWLVDHNNTVLFQPVTVGDWKGNSWFINEGLKNGDRIIIDGGIKVQAGETVNVKG